MKRAAIVVNPVAGAGEAWRQAERARELLEGEGFSVEVHATRGPGDAEPVARELRERVDLLVVAGGDGSIREAIAGLGEESRRVTVAVLPCGNANVVARELGIPLRRDAALELLRTGRPRSIDLGRIGSDLFLAMVGIGWDARTVHLLSRMRRTRLGRGWYRLWADSAYFVAGIAALFVRRRDRLQIAADGQPHERCYCAAIVANFRSYGKGWAMVPDAHHASGRLHYQARKRFGPLFVGWHLIAAFLRRRSPAFVSDHGEGTHVTVRSERPFFVQVDGDDRGAFTEVELRVEPDAARLLAPGL